MLIGAISDIHANLDALESALTLLHAQRVGMILCAGDLVDGGNQGDAVVTLVQKRLILSAKGNHDQAAHEQQNWLRRAFALDDPRISPNLLAAKTVRYLNSLPL